jgi:hypothetical protein
MRARIPILVSVVLVFAGCASGAASTEPPATLPPVTTAPTVVPAAATPASPATPAPTKVSTALETVWHTGVITDTDMKKALQKAGLQQWIQPFLSQIAGKQNLFTLSVTDGHWAMYWSKDGGPMEITDDGAYQIDGSQVTAIHNDGGNDIYQWAVDGDTLTITYTGNTFPPQDGIPEDAYQTAFYMSGPWLRGAK